MAGRIDWRICALRLATLVGCPSRWLVAEPAVVYSRSAWVGARRRHRDRRCRHYLRLRNRLCKSASSKERSQAKARGKQELVNEIEYRVVTWQMTSALVT